MFSIKAGYLPTLGDGDVDGEEEDVSKASKLSAGARILRGP